MPDFAAGRITALAAFLFEVPHVRYRLPPNAHHHRAAGRGSWWSHYRTRATGLAMAVGACQTHAACLDRVI